MVLLLPSLANMSRWVQLRSCVVYVGPEEPAVPCVGPWGGGPQVPACPCKGIYIWMWQYANKHNCMELGPPIAPTFAPHTGPRIQN